MSPESKLYNYEEITRFPIEELIIKELEEKIVQSQENYDYKTELLSKKFLIHKQYMLKPMYEISDYAYKLFNTKQSVFEFLDNYESITNNFDFIILYTQLLHLYGIKYKL